MVSPTKGTANDSAATNAQDGDQGLVDPVATSDPKAVEEGQSPAITANNSAQQSVEFAPTEANVGTAVAENIGATNAEGDKDGNGHPLLPPFEIDAASVRTSTSVMTIATVEKDKRTSTSVTTTARRKKAKPKNAPPKAKKPAKEKQKPARKYSRVKATRKKIARKVDPNDPAYAVIEKFQRDDRNFVGTIVGKKSKNFKIKFDDFPSEHAGIVLDRKSFIVIDKDEDVPEYDRKTAEEEMIAEECARAEEETKKENYRKKSTEEFLSLSIDDLKTACSYEMKYGEEDSDKITWTILKDEEQITEDAMTIDAGSAMKKDIDWSPDTMKVDYNAKFFELFFPSIEGKAKVIDKFLDNKNCSMYDTKVHDKIKFHRDDNEDPDVLVKLCITILITAACEVEKGVENLFKQGLSDGFKDYPNYSQYIPKNYMKCFILAFPFLWCDEKYWHQDPRNLSWDVIAPFLHEYNKVRTDLIDVTYLILDESMSAWRPKTSKTGGLPHITHEPRKPKDLGTMVRNGAECQTGIFVHHDIVQEPSTQRLKKYQIDEEDESKLCKSHLPQGEQVLDHVAECLRQVEGAKLKEGGWVGGDAWFGSINACVELKARKNIFSTFIVKQNIAYYPMQELKAILLARYGSRPGGHWAVMKTNISGVDLFAMIYAWSHNNFAYMVSSCGTTIRHVSNYQSKFQDEMGGVGFKEFPRPAVAHLIYEFAPLIDEHNKARQSSLALEECWLTKSCWFRLMTTFTAMAVVDLQRWDRYMRSNSDEATAMHLDGDFTILKMASLIGRPLRTGELKYRHGQQPSSRSELDSDGNMKPITRIQGDDGSITYKSETGKRDRVRQKRCYICRRYTERYQNTQWCCRKCKMPLCQVSRGRKMTCVEEHLTSKNDHLGCNNIIYKVMPPELLCYPTSASAPRAGTKRGRNTEANVTPSPRKTRSRSRKS